LLPVPGFRWYIGEENTDFFNVNNRVSSKNRLFRAGMVCCKKTGLENKVTVPQDVQKGLPFRTVPAARIFSMTVR